MTTSAWVLLVIVVLPFAVGAVVSAQCGGRTRTTTGPCRRLSKGLLQRCRDHQGQLVGADAVTAVCWGLAALGAWVWWQLDLGPVLDLRAAVTPAPTSWGDLQVSR